jgi:hypothetical protein
MPRREADERGRQPRDVSEHVRNSLRMTAPRTRRPVRPIERERSQRQHLPPIDNEGLALDEGNDFA